MKKIQYGQKLLKNILITDPAKRYKFEQIKNHPWMKLANKDLTVRQWVVATVDGIGTVDWARKCNYVRVEDGFIIFEAVHRNDPSQYLILLKPFLADLLLILDMPLVKL